MHDFVWGPSVAETFRFIYDALSGKVLRELTLHHIANMYQLPPLYDTT